MKQLYIKPKVGTICLSNRFILCMSGATTIEQKPNTKKYGCPIKQGVDCPDYDKHMHKCAIFHQGPDENYCPRKTCPIYLKWKKQQKTR